MYSNEQHNQIIPISWRYVHAWDAFDKPAYIVCGLFTKKQEYIKSRKQKAVNIYIYIYIYIYQNELETVYFQLDIAHWAFRDLPKGAVSDNRLRNKAFKTTINSQYDEYQGGIASIVYKFFDNYTRGITTHIRGVIIS